MLMYSVLCIQYNVSYCKGSGRRASVVVGLDRTGVGLGSYYCGLTFQAEWQIIITRVIR